MDVYYSEWAHHGESSNQNVEDDILDHNLSETFDEEEMLEDLNFGMHSFDDPNSFSFIILMISMLSNQMLFHTMK